MVMHSARFNYWDHAYRIDAFRLTPAFDAFSEKNFRSLIALGFKYGNGELRSLHGCSRIPGTVFKGFGDRISDIDAVKAAFDGN